MDGIIINDVLYEVVEDVKGCDICDLRDFCDENWARCIACDIINTGCTVFKKVSTNKVEIPVQINDYFY